MQAACEGDRWQDYMNGQCVKDSWDRKMRLRRTVRPYKKTAVVRMRRDQTETWQHWGSPRSARSFKQVRLDQDGLDQITRHSIVIEHLHFTAVAGWYMKTFYVSYIHHQLIFHELFIWRPLTLLAGKTSPKRIHGKSRGKIHYTPAISGEVVRS